MDQPATINALLDQVQQQLMAYLTAEKIKTDFFETEESVDCPLYNWDDEVISTITIEPEDPFTVYQFSISSLDARHTHVVRIKAGIGEMDISMPHVTASKCYGEFEYRLPGFILDYVTFRDIH